MATLPTRICVFCASTTGTSPAHLAAAQSLAKALHAHNIHLVYGGGTTGLMGALAETLVALSGPDAVLGIVPRGIVAEKERPGNGKSGGIGGREKEDGNEGWWARKVHKRGQRYNKGSGGSNKDDNKNAAVLTNEATYGRIQLVDSLSERKQVMAQQIALGGPGSGFLALSGGFGTMDEVMEVVTLYQFGIHRRRVCLFSVEGYWDDVESWLARAIREGFVREEMKDVIGVETDAEGCVRWLREGKGKEEKVR
ncbi:hypothetical protein ACLMJK_000039 [Lecanora helva]